MSKGERLKPSTNTLKRLYADSAGYCAIDMKPLIHMDFKMVGRIAHIESVKPNGARYNENMTAEEKRAYENLICICSDCHDLIDSKENEDDWTVERLYQIKRNHKDKMNSLQNSFVNLTAGVEYVRPTNLAFYFSIDDIVVNDDLYNECFGETIDQFNKLIDNLRSVTSEIRRFYFEIITMSKDKLTVKRHTVENTLTLNATKIVEYVSILKENGICSYDEDEDLFRFDELLHFIALIDKPGVNVLDESLINLDFSWAD
ncbi:hypothetical protein CYV26_11330 [Carnobacterium maltaromaticum]|uniref:hypothetical protein n=1 Tax=Carnobacterium maltaromaticum TaxID=2751 RepID=UPI000C78ACFE|nr:hypothetical protein [Carnobacterium maltaromaticum]PLS34094.1 hypothetical protein CYV30_12495 [Carnobacterium maltaromaticum]PLS34229.1 hypothetical protein CYV33_11315 [Carnobacterium maltaromaticum]PLS34365.1 hypothetical protein CYV31_12475 [Carnobacterium maltaromaticum]PLS41693.1 hypothetical protein CYV28_12430 [Carnobacterium maltaromaticum]PLS43175.1 hypothetical protein CYV27_11315 [Carnobacterium maltaromaticum]